MKKLIVAVAVAGFALSASADVLQEWKFDDPVTDNLYQMDNTGSAGVDYGWGDPTKWVTDGVGNLVLPGTGNDWKGTSAFTTLAGSGTYSLEMKVASWANVTGSGNSDLKFRLRDAGGGAICAIQFNVNDAGAGFTLISAGTNYRGHNVGGQVSTGPVSARIDFNLAAGTAAYFVNGIAKETFDTQTFAAMSEFGLSRESGWANATTSVSIDEMSLSVIPEPATLGLVAMVGGGLLFIRRRFKI